MTWERWCNLSSHSAVCAGEMVQIVEKSCSRMKENVKILLESTFPTAFRAQEKRKELDLAKLQGRIKIWKPNFVQMYLQRFPVFSDLHHIGLVAVNCQVCCLLQLLYCFVPTHEPFPLWKLWSGHFYLLTLKASQNSPLVCCLYHNLTCIRRVNLRP